MAAYQYIAKSSDGKRVAGELQADSEAAVVAALADRGLFPVSIDLGAETKIDQHAFRLSTRDAGLIYQQISDLLRAGTPILRAIATMERAMSKPTAKALLGAVREKVAAGETFADALSDHPKAFPPLHVAMIRAGEQGGFLEDVLTNTADFVERIDELRSKVMLAMLYPVLVSLVGAGVVLFLMLGPIRWIRPFFDNIPLPLPTQILFAGSDGLILYWPVVIIACVLAPVGVYFLFKQRATRRVWEQWRLYIPVVGQAMRMVAISRFCRILGSMLKNGVPLIKSLEISRDATGSVMLSDTINEAIEAVRTGEPMTGPLRSSPLFPDQIVEMVAIAEESNQVENTLLTIADTVDKRTARQVDQVVRLIEPAMLVMVAGVVLFIAMSILYPLLTMARSVQGG